MKRTSFLALPAAVFFASLLPSCQSVPTGATETERTRISEVKANEASYRATAERFVRHAQDGDSRAMAGMISRVGIKEMGGETTVRSTIEKEVLHGFANATVDWRQKSSWGYTAHGKIGLWFQGTATRGDWHNRFRIMVFEEDERLVVACIMDDQ